MAEQTFHAIRKTGNLKTVIENPDREFDPRQFHRALVDLVLLTEDFQELTWVPNFNRGADFHSSDKYERKDILSSDDELLDSKIKIGDDTLLAEIYSVLPKGWNVSVVIDGDNQSVYAVHGMMYCGGHNECRFTAQLTETGIPSMIIEFTDLSSDETNAVVEFETPLHPGENTHIEKVSKAATEAVYHGYIHALPSVAQAIDFIEAGNIELFYQKNSQVERLSQNEWANVRDVTQETINSNINEVEEYLGQLPDIDPFDERKPALCEAGSETSEKYNIPTLSGSTEQGIGKNLAKADMSQSDDEIYEMIKNTRRRLAITELQNGPLATPELASRIAAEENDKPIDELSKKEYKRRYVSLVQTHLPKMDDYGLVKLTNSGEHVESTEDGKKLAQYLENLEVPDGDEELLGSIFDILKNERRRQVLQFLQNRDEISLSTLAENIAAKELNKPISGLSSPERKRIYVGLYQVHLPKMDDVDIIDFDGNRGTISLSTKSDLIFQYL